MSIYEFMSRAARRDARKARQQNDGVNVDGFYRREGESVWNARGVDVTFTDAEVSAILAVAYGEGEAFTKAERDAWRSAYRKLTGHELDWGDQHNYQPWGEPPPREGE